MTFKDYVATRRAGYDVQGDFVRLAKADKAMPEMASWDDLRGYIERRGDFTAVEAGRSVWKEYEGVAAKAEGRKIKAADPEDLDF